MSHLSSVLVSLPEERLVLVRRVIVCMEPAAWHTEQIRAQMCLCPSPLWSVPSRASSAAPSMLSDDSSAEPRLLSQGPVTQESLWSLMIMTSKRVSLVTQPHCSASSTYCCYWCNNNSCVTCVLKYKFSFVLCSRSSLITVFSSRMTICSPE